MADIAAHTLRWNGVPGDGVGDSLSWPELWARFQAAVPELSAHGAGWEQQMLAHGDLASNLLEFAMSVQAVARQNSGIMPG